MTEESITQTFYLAVAFFGISCCLGGPYLERYGPRRVATIGIGLFVLGQWIAALGCYLRNPTVLYIGFGCIGGFGIGTTYICPIAGK